MTPGAITHDALYQEQANTTRFGRCVGLSLLSLVALYSVYAVGAYVALGPVDSLVHRLVKLFGMAVFPLPLLAAPATYFAALEYFELRCGTDSSVRRGHWRQLGFVALGTYVVMVVAPLGYDYAVRAVIGSYDAVLPEGMVTNNARLMLPFAVALFVIVSGVGGAVTGRITRGFKVGRRYAARWTMGAVLVGSFLATIVVIANLIAMRGLLSPPWLALAPPAVPFALVCVMARRDCARVIRSIAARFGRRGGDRPGEIDTLVTAMTQVAAPAIVIDEVQVRSIVADLTATKAPPVVRAAGTRRVEGTPRWREMAGGFAGSWAYLSVGFLWLGGAGLSPPTVVSALSAGLIGAAGAVLTSR